MDKKFKSKYRIPTNRLQGYDCGSNGWYFVTICTENSIHYFGEIVKPHHHLSKTSNENHNAAYLQPTEIGSIANEYWLSIPQHYPFVILDEFIIMPNHLHGIIHINKDDDNDWHPNRFGQQSNNLAAIIRGFKSSVKRYANNHEIVFHWQPRFHDHIITNEKALFAIRNYIKRNPENWPRGKNNEQGLQM